MTTRDSLRVPELLHGVDAAATPWERGRALERFVAELLTRVPGLAVHDSNVVNITGSEEVDVVFWNERLKRGLHFFENVLLAECKNLSEPASSAHIGLFHLKLQQRGERFGLFFALNGVTGNFRDLNAAHAKIRDALAGGFRIFVITRRDLLQLQRPSHIVHLLKTKYCQLVGRGTSLVED